MHRSIHFHVEEVQFSLATPQVEVEWIEKIIELESKVLGEVNFIFSNDENLLKMNQKYLKHDYYTDVITFNYNEDAKLSGDIFISIDRLKDNAKMRAIPFETELRRVMIHGVLHLIGYNDEDAETQATMRSKEDFCLNLHPLRKNEGST